MSFSFYHKNIYHVYDFIDVYPFIFDGYTYVYAFIHTWYVMLHVCILYYVTLKITFLYIQFVIQSIFYIIRLFICGSFFYRKSFSSYLNEN